MRAILTYLAENPWRGLTTRPTNVWVALAVAAVYALLALWLGTRSGLLEYRLLESPLAPILPFTLFVLPSVVEETIFRGTLIPQNALERGAGTAALFVVLSTAAFVLWHPFYAQFLNPKAATFFLDGRFLLLAALLGLTCAIQYVLTRSLWVPIATHWVTVLVWVYLFGGRNMILD